MGVKQNFIRNLKKFRNHVGLSQMKLADRCDTSASYIGEIEIGKKFPSVEMIERVAGVLNVEPYKFFMDEEAVKIIKPEKTENADEFLAKMPERIRTEIEKRLLKKIKTEVRKSLAPIR
jgi:transcriptional regulator with XRE-family HTH domain